MIEYGQSSYRKYHSTETALLQVHIDILQDVDYGEGWTVYSWSIWNSAGVV